MEKRRITLQDGRYLIYYSFEEEEEPARSEAGNPSEKDNPSREIKPEE